MESCGVTSLGTIVCLPDGRVGTVVYNSLIGVGIKWGRHNPAPEDFEGTSGDTVECELPDDWPWQPDALLREPEMTERLGIECVCPESEVKILES